MTNGIEDPMSSKAYPAKSMAPSTAVEALRTSVTACLDFFNFSDVASFGSIAEMIGFQGVKANRECPVITSHGNMFAKKINIGDNFSGFGEYINKYMDFVYGMEASGIKLMPIEKATRLEHIVVGLINTKGFLKKC